MTKKAKAIIINWKGVEILKFEINKKILLTVIIITLLISAILYNFLYTNDEKNEITNDFEVEEKEESEEADVVEVVNSIFVDVGGEVNNPGLYELKENARVNDAINAAGGTTDKADLTDVNLAYILTDAVKVIIPAKNSANSVNSVKNVSVINSGINSASSNNIQSGKVNLNTATKEQLKTLTGIGDSTAQKIIDYRNENGKFNNVEDIMNVSGVGDSKYQKIKNDITV